MAYLYNYEFLRCLHVRMLLVMNLERSLNIRLDIQSVLFLQISSQQIESKVCKRCHGTRKLHLPKAKSNKRNAKPLFCKLGDITKRNQRGPRQTEGGIMCINLKTQCYKNVTSPKINL